MTNTHMKTIGGAAIAAIFLSVSAVAFSAHAETTFDRTRDISGRLSVTPSISVPSLLPTAPTPPSGITSVTNGAVDSGGNTGGNVTTGDQHVSVHEVNVGPTNNTPAQPGATTPPPVPPTPPAPPCDPRSREGCVSQDDAGRDR